MRVSATCAVAIAIAGIALPDTAAARRTTIDIGATFDFAGYCSRQQLDIPGGDCEPTSLPFSVVLDGKAYDTVVVHSNGAVSLGGPLNFDAFSNSLRDFDAPVFSPLLRNGLGPEEFDRDGEFVAQFEIEADGFRVNWFSCANSVNCFRNNFSLVLKDTAQGFNVDYIYGPNGPTFNGLSGFSLPSGTVESFGPLQNRSFAFDANGSLLGSAVPEPSTWAMMLVGFGLIGGVTRLRRAPAAGRA
jgi:hypothetical protein